MPAFPGALFKRQSRRNWWIYLSFILAYPISLMLDQKDVTNVHLWKVAPLAIQILYPTPAGWAFVCIPLCVYVGLLNLALALALILVGRPTTLGGFEGCLLIIGAGVLCYRLARIRQ